MRAQSSFRLYDSISGIPTFLEISVNLHTLGDSGYANTPEVNSLVQDTS